MPARRGPGETPLPGVTRSARVGVGCRHETTQGKGGAVQSSYDMSNELAGKTVLVTGGAGLIGSRIVQQPERRRPPDPWPRARRRHATATVRALVAPRAHNEVFNVGTGPPTSVRRIAELVREQFPAPCSWRLRCARRPARRIRGHPPPGACSGPAAPHHQSTRRMPRLSGRGGIRLPV